MFVVQTSIRALEPVKFFLRVTSQINDTGTVSERNFKFQIKEKLKNGSNEVPTWMDPEIKNGPGTNFGSYTKLEKST